MSALPGVLLLALVGALGLAGCSKLPVELKFDGGGGGGGDGRGADGCVSGPCSTDGPPTADLPPGGDGQPPPAFDWRDAIMYFVVVDRFFDGDSSNNKPESGVEQPANWQGGDLAGVLAKLKGGYFEQLGVNAIWLTSPVDAPEGKFAGKDGHDYTGFHGYWPTELDKVEERLGDMALLKQVVAEAHTRGIRIVLDYVMNHTHQQSSTYKDHPGWFWSLDLSGKSCICGGGCSWAPPEGLRCWFDPFLPDFNFTVKEARDFSVANAIQWAKDSGADGFRLDAVKHIEMSWLTDLRARVKSELISGTKSFYLIGETFDGDRSLLKQFIDPATKLDGQFDFPLRAQLVKNVLMRQGSLQELDTFLSTNDTFYGAGAIMGSFLGNHDLPRAIHLAEDSPQFGEWDDGKKRAWNNPPTLPSASAPFERLGVAFAAILTLPGVPTIYYGDELGMAGGGDPDNRRFMAWSGTTAPQDKLRALVTKLIGIRKEHPALRRGTRQQVWLGADVYGYKRTSGGDQLTVVLNRSDSEQTIQLTGATSFKDLLTGETITASSVKVPARSARVLQ